MKKTKADFTRLQDELMEIIEIEQRLQENKETSEDVDRMEAIARNGSPRAEFDIGMCVYCGIKREISLKGAFEWFDKCRMHAGSELQMELGYIYFTNGMTDESNDCLRRMAEDDPIMAERLMEEINKIRSGKAENNQA